MTVVESSKCLGISEDKTHHRLLLKPAVVCFVHRWWLGMYSGLGLNAGPSGWLGCCRTTCALSVSRAFWRWIRHFLSEGWEGDWIERRLSWVVPETLDKHQLAISGWVTGFTDPHKWRKTETPAQSPSKVVCHLNLWFSLKAGLTFPGKSQVMLTLVFNSAMAVQFKTSLSPLRVFRGLVLFSFTSVTLLTGTNEMRKEIFNIKRQIERRNLWSIKHVSVWVIGAGTVC